MDREKVSQQKDKTTIIGSNKTKSVVDDDFSLGKFHTIFFVSLSFLNNFIDFITFNES